MRRFYLFLVILTLLLTVAAWFGFRACAMPILMALPLYFAVVSGVQYYTVANSLQKDPRTFIKNFLGLTVGTLFLHLVVLSLWSFTHIPTAKPFIIAFGIGFTVYLLYITLMLVLLVRKYKK